MITLNELLNDKKYRKMSVKELADIIGKDQSFGGLSNDGWKALHGDFPSEKAKILFDKWHKIPKVKSKQTVLHWEKKGKEYKLLGWENILKYNELPEKYIDSSPHYYEDIHYSPDTSGYDIQNSTPKIMIRDNGLVHTDDCWDYYILRGETVNEDTFKKIIHAMKVAGARLIELNMQKTKTFTVVI